MTKNSSKSQNQKDSVQKRGESRTLSFTEGVEPHEVAGLLKTDQLAELVRALLKTPNPPPPV